MRRKKLTGLVVSAGLAVGLLAAPIAGAKPVAPPGQACHVFLMANPAITVENAQGTCASFVAQGGNLVDEFPPGLCNELTGCRPPPILQ